MTIVGTRLNRMRIALTAGGLAIAGVAVGLAVAVLPAGAAHATGQGPVVASRVVLVNQCNGTALVRPRSFALPGCMPSNELIGHASWTSWRSAGFGQGDLEVNNCTPSSKCGPAQYTRYPVLLVAWRAERWHGGSAYTRLTWIFTGRRRRHSAVTQTVTLRLAS